MPTGLKNSNCVLCLRTQVQRLNHDYYPKRVQLGWVLKDVPEICIHLQQLIKRLRCHQWTTQSLRPGSRGKLLCMTAQLTHPRKLRRVFTDIWSAAWDEAFTCSVRLDGFQPGCNSNVWLNFPELCLTRWAPVVWCPSVTSKVVSGSWLQHQIIFYWSCDHWEVQSAAIMSPTNVPFSEKWWTLCGGELMIKINVIVMFC